MKRRFPWWVYLLAAFLACGIIGSLARTPEPAPTVPSSQASAGLGLPAPFPTATRPAAKASLLPTSTIPPETTPTTRTEAPPAGNPGLTGGAVARVVDGDTLDVTVAGRTYRVRIIGVDTPETVDPSRPVMCFGAEATRKTQELVDLAGGQVALEKDVSETDRYGRLLRYVWLKHPDGTRMLNEELVKWGYAQVSTYPPDVKYQQQFLAAEREAREQNRGLWAACSSFGAPVATPTPRPARAVPTPTLPPIAEQPAPSGGSVKISYIYYDGQEYRSEGDEYVTITNNSGKPANLRGYRINAGDRGQDFTFPSFVLNPGQDVQVYTNRDIQGSFSFHRGSAIWNNKGDCGYLFDATGKQISDYCY